MLGSSVFGCIPSSFSLTRSLTTLLFCLSDYFCDARLILCILLEKLPTFMVLPLIKLELLLLDQEFIRRVNSQFEDLEVDFLEGYCFHLDLAYSHWLLVAA